MYFFNVLYFPLAIRSLPITHRLFYTDFKDVLSLCLKSFNVQLNCFAFITSLSQEIPWIIFSVFGQWSNAVNFFIADMFILPSQISIYQVLWIVENASTSKGDLILLSQPRNIVLSYDSCYDLDGSENIWFNIDFGTRTVQEKVGLLLYDEPTGQDTLQILLKHAGKYWSFWITLYKYWLFLWLQ